MKYAIYLHKIILLVCYLTLNEYTHEQWDDILASSDDEDMFEVEKIGEDEIIEVNMTTPIVSKNFCTGIF